MSGSIIENLCDVKHSYRAEPVSIQNEEHTIETAVPYSISLKEKPSLDHSVTISGYNESDCAPSVETDFYIDYDASLIYFFYTEAGKSVQVTYYGGGSPIIAGDVNRFSFFLDNLYAVLFSFYVEALSGCRVRIYGGKFVDSVTGNVINTQKELFMDFGLNGNYELCSLSTGYFKKILIGIDVSTSQIAVIEGVEAAKYGETLLPSYTSIFRPVAIITVSENSGFISDIVQSDIISVQNYLPDIMPAIVELYRNISGIINTTLGSSSYSSIVMPSGVECKGMSVKTRTAVAFTISTNSAGSNYFSVEGDGTLSVNLAKNSEEVIFWAKADSGSPVLEIILFDF